jgi:hypothetical protein
LILKYAENYSHEELAEIFHLSVSACKMRISRAREKIQERFGEKTEGEGREAGGGSTKSEVGGPAAAGKLQSEVSSADARVPSIDQ